MRATPAVADLAPLAATKNKELNGALPNGGGDGPSFSERIGCALPTEEWIVDLAQIMLGSDTKMPTLMSAAHGKPNLWPVHTLEQAIEMIEEMTGEELAAEDLEQLRQIYSDDDEQRESVH